MPTALSVTTAVSTRAVLALIGGCLAGCATSPSLIPLDGAPADDLSLVAGLREDFESLLLRGVDRMPTPIYLPLRTQVVFLIKPGRRILWAKNVPYPYPLIPQKIRCYVIDAELAAGVLYRLEEDAERKTALLQRDDTRQLVASGPLVDEPWIFAADCRWP
jgi:hypothetical protein